jgi:hypothetical protein
MKGRDYKPQSLDEYQRATKSSEPWSPTSKSLGTVTLPAGLLALKAQRAKPLTRAPRVNKSPAWSRKPLVLRV